MTLAISETARGPAVIAPRRWPGMQKDFEKE